MNEPVLDVYVGNQRIGTLSEEADAFVFRYRDEVPESAFVSLTMPVRLASYAWKTLHPVFQMNLPEGYKKDLLRQTLGPHASVSDIGLLALTGRNTIGRVRVVPKDAPLEMRNPHLEMVELLASTDSQAHLLRFLQQGVVEGVSGVMPKTLQSGEKATAWIDDYILKTGRPDLPGLAINEYLCLEVARHAGLPVPATRLSQDGGVLVIQRFDRDADGRPLGVEDFCSLSALDPANKYQSTLERLPMILQAYVPLHQQQQVSTQFFTLLLVNYAVRNADAHLKNFSLTYTNWEDVALAPAYDIVTVTAYPEYRDDLPALPLAGKRVWASGKLLTQYGATRLSLTAATMNACREAVNAAVQHVLSQVADCAARYPAFREVGKRMMAEWELGLASIAADARPGPLPAPTARKRAGLSDEKRPTKPANPYVDENGAFSHKIR